MPEGKLNCCCQPPHCGIVFADVTAPFIGMPCPLPGDWDQTWSIDGATSTGPEKTDFSTITARYGMQGTWGYVDQEMPDCSYYSPIRYLKEEVHYFGKVWGDAALHDFDYTYTREKRFELPSPNSHIYHDHAVNIDEDAYDWSIDTDTGVVTETGVLTDVLFTAPGYGEGGSVFIPPLSSVYGSAEFSVLAGVDTDGDGYPDSISLSLVVHVPADYHSPGSAAYDVTLVRTFSIPFNYDALETAANFMLDHIQLERPGHIYDSNDGYGTWTTSGGGDRLLVWGYEYSPVWSCEVDVWPNRVVVLEIDFLLFTATFMELASKRLASYNQIELLRSRFGVAEGDTGCLVSRKANDPELPGAGDGVLDLTPCTLGGGGDIIGDPYINCHAGALGPGNYVFSGAGDFANGVQHISRRYMMDGAIGTPTTELPDCIDSLAEWDGTNPDPEGEVNGCCFPPPP